MDTQQYGQALAFICWTDEFTRTTAPGTGIGSDYTWQNWDSYWGSLAESTTYVDGNRIVIAEQVYDSYSINRTVPLAGSVQFDFFVPPFDNTAHTGQWRQPTYGVQFGANWASGVLALYVGTAFDAGNDHAWLIGSINGSLTTNGNGVEFTPDDNTMYTAKMVYNDAGDVVYKVWKTSDVEPVEFLFRDTVVGFTPYNTAWIDIFYAPYVGDGFFDNLTFCYDVLPSLSQGYGNAQAKINAFGINAFGQAQALITNTTPTGCAQAYINWELTTLPFVDDFNRTTTFGLGTPYWKWQVGYSSFDHPAASNTHVDGGKVIVPQDGDYLDGDSYELNITAMPSNYEVRIEVKFVGQTQSIILIPPYADYAQLVIGYDYRNILFAGFTNGNQGGAGIDLTKHYRLIGKVVGDKVEYDVRIVETDQRIGIGGTLTAPYRPFNNTPFGDHYLITFYNYQNATPWSFDNFALLPGFRAFGQAQATIITTTPNAQAQARIKRIEQGYGQAQAKVRTTRMSGQAQADIYNPYRWANAQGHIVTLNNNRFGQAQSLLNTGFGLGQAQAYISFVRVSQVVAETLGTSTNTSAIVSQLVVEVLLPTVPTARRFGQAQGYIGTHFFVQGQAQAFILKIVGFAQAQAKINSYNNTVYAQALATIFTTVNQYGQSKADIKVTSNRYGQAQALIIHVAFGQAQGTIKAKVRGYGQAKASILATSRRYGQAQGTTLFIGVAQATVIIFRPTFIYRVFGAANALIRPRNKGFALAQATIERVIKQTGLARAKIGDRVGHGNARARITGVVNATGQAQAFMNRFNQYGNAQGYINSFDYNRYGQAQGKINSFDYNQYGQALATLATRWWQGGQALANIHKEYWTFGQALAVIGRASHTGQARAVIVPNTSIRLTAQAQAQIVGYYYGIGNARASIERTIKSGLAQGYILQTRAGGLVRYGSMILPGYYNSESMDSPLRIMINNIAYDENLMEITGLENKHISITMQVIDETYIKTKEKVLLAGTMLRSNRTSYEKLTLINPDRYYLVKPEKISMQQTAGRNENNASYRVDFECRPWLYGYETHQLTGTTTLDTNSVGRTFLNGTWTPAKLTLTGTNITVSGYTPTGGFTGYVSVSGSVTNLVINSDLFSTDMSAQNMDPIMNIDYRLSIGPGRTLFDVNGATECTIEYQDRWNL